MNATHVLVGEGHARHDVFLEEGGEEGIAGLEGGRHPPLLEHLQHETIT